MWDSLGIIPLTKYIEPIFLIFFNVRAKNVVYKIRIETQRKNVFVNVS